MLINYTSLFLMWTLLSESLGRAEQNNANFLQLIQEFSHLYSNKFVVLIKPNNPTGDRLPVLINIRNVFSRSRQFYTSISDFTQFFASFNEGTTRNLRMTTVYAYFDSIIIPDLNAMLKSEYRGMLTWLCEIPSERSISMLNNVNAPLNSKFFIVRWADDASAKIFEMYDIPRSEMQVNYFGEWDDKNGLRVGEKDLGKRRKNLRGTVTNFFTYNNRGDGECKREVYLKNSRYFFECYSMQQWQYIGKYLNYTTNFLNFQTTDEGNAMVNEVSSGRCDSGPFAIVISNRRKNQVNFLLPRWRTRLSLLAAVAGNEISLSSFLKPFSHNFWMALAAWLVFTGLVFAVLVYVVDRAAYHQESADHFLNFYIPFQAICLQGCTLKTSWTGLRIILFICYIIPVIMMTAYSGGIISSLAKPERIPFDTLKEFEENGEYKITTIQGLYPTSLLENDEIFERSRQRSLIVKKLSRDTEEAFNDLCTKKVVLFEARKTLSINAPNCKVYYLKDGEKFYFVARVLSPHFPVSDAMTTFTLKIMESGINHKDLYKVALSKYNFELVKSDSLGRNADAELTLNPAALENLTLLYTILLTGMGLSMLVFLFEIRADRGE